MAEGTEGFFFKELVICWLSYVMLEVSLTLALVIKQVASRMPNSV